TRRPPGAFARLTKGPVHCGPNGNHSTKNDGRNFYLGTKGRALWRSDRSVRRTVIRSAFWKNDGRRRRSSATTHGSRWHSMTAGLCRTPFMRERKSSTRPKSMRLASSLAPCTSAGYSALLRTSCDHRTKEKSRNICAANEDARSGLLVPTGLRGATDLTIA